MTAWVIVTIIVMALLAIAFAVFIAEADRERTKGLQRSWLRPRDRRSQPRN